MHSLKRFTICTGLTVVNVALLNLLKGNDSIKFSPMTKIETPFTVPFHVRLSLSNRFQREYIYIMWSYAIKRARSLRAKRIESCKLITLTKIIIKQNNICVRAIYIAALRPYKT